MIIKKNIISNLCQDVCNEFQALGFKKDIDPRTLKESYNIAKHQDGSWHKSSKLGLHGVLTKCPLDFTVMPILKKLTDSIDNLDAEFQKTGGRIFITETLVYKVKKGTMYPLVSSNSSNESTEIILTRYRQLCDEILAQGSAQDRFRTDETYIISKTNNGEWSMTTSHENFSARKKIFNLNEMPLLKMLANKINKTDSSFQTNGGRIFVTPTRIYRLKNKLEIDFKI